MNNDIYKQIGRLVVLMEDWANWQRGYSGIKGYPSHSIGLQSGYVSSTFEDMCDSVDNEVFRAIDAAVSDLVEGQAAAINKRYGVSAVFRFPRGNYEELLIEAHQVLMTTLPKKGVVI